MLAAGIAVLGASLLLNILLRCNGFVRIQKTLESIFCLLLVLGKNFVEMVEEVVVGWQEVR